MNKITVFGVNPGCLANLLPVSCAGVLKNLTEAVVSSTTSTYI